jgi:uncharacterized protein (UPF0264 family)
MTSFNRPAADRVRFLASVISEAEARTALAAGADIIDCKNPVLGALGALDVAIVRAVRMSLPPHIQVSATIGDVPCEPDAVVNAIGVMAATGVDYVKAGLFAEGNARATVRRLGALDFGPCRLVGVLFADQKPDFSLIAEIGKAGFAGVMLDTAEKGAGSLPDHMPRRELVRFIAEARAAGLFAGLAGALRAHHVAGLVALDPDVIGFRGALCRDTSRTGDLDRTMTEAIRLAIDEAAYASSEIARKARYA